MIDLIQFVGLNDLQESSQHIVKNLSEKYIFKIRNNIRKATSIKVHIKQKKKSDHLSFYTALIQVIVPHKVHEIEKEDRDLTILVRKSFQALTNEVNHYTQSR
jgi:hypothetical protein